jgi:hypothetical protein
MSAIFGQPLLSPESLFLPPPSARHTGGISALITYVYLPHTHATLSHVLDLCPAVAMLRVYLTDTAWSGQSASSRHWLLFLPVISIPPVSVLFRPGDLSASSAAFFAKLASLYPALDWVDRFSTCPASWSR